MTPTRRLIDLNLGGTLDTLVSDLRDGGHSWASIAHELATRTGVRVSDETLRIWFAERVNS